MAFKGKSKQEKGDFVKELYVGLTSVRVAAINPTRAQLNKLLGKVEEGEEKDEFKYLDTDKDGNTRLRLAFWLYDEENDKYFVQSIMLTDEVRKSKDGKKVQIINSTCGTSWVPFKEDKDGELTSEANEDLIQDWFLQFTDRNTKEVTGDKKWRMALRGEEELATLLRAWVSMDWNDPETDVMVDMKKLFQENLKELRDIVGSEEYSRPFVILTGVKTSEEDSTKKYQQVFNKAYLPAGFMRYIKAGNKMPSDYTKTVWKKFTTEVGDQYGFTCFHKLKPLEVYNEKEDPVAGNAGKPKVTQPQNNEY